MPNNILSLVLTYCSASIATKNQTPKQTCQHFLLPTSISLAFNIISMPEPDATRDKHSAKLKFARQQFKGALNLYIIHQLSPASSRTSRACPLVSSPITCNKSCASMYWTHLLVSGTQLHCPSRNVVKRHPWVPRPVTVRLSPAAPS